MSVYTSRLLCSTIPKLSLDRLRESRYHSSRLYHRESPILSTLGRDIAYTITQMSMLHAYNRREVGPTLWGEADNSGMSLKVTTITFSNMLFFFFHGEYSQRA
jgi:hypothetical protein